MKKPELRALRRKIGMVFQQFNLLESKTVYHNIALPLILAKTPKVEIDKKVKEVLKIVELEDKKDTYISQLSGGQKQRVGIARALTTDPELLLCDEATSALDPQTTESNLKHLKNINRKMGVTILLITHQMQVVQMICNKVAVMESGKIVESGSDREIFYDPKHPYTRGLLQCVHNPEKKEKLKPIAGSPPDLLKPPAGCPFVDRCPEAMKVCKLYMPEVTTYSATHQCACWLEEANRRKGENHG